MAVQEIGAQITTQMPDWVVAQPETVAKRVRREQTAWFNDAVNRGEMPGWVAPLALKVAIFLEEWRLATDKDLLPNSQAPIDY